MERDEWEDFINYVDNIIRGKSPDPKSPAPKPDLKTTPSGDDKPVKVTMTPDGKYTTQTYTKREQPKHGEHLPRYVGKVRCIDSAGDRCQLFVRVDDPEEGSPSNRSIIHIGFALDGDAEGPDDYYLDITSKQSLALRSMLEQAEYYTIIGDVEDVE
jgi:hypothetical protein